MFRLPSAEKDRSMASAPGASDTVDFSSAEAAVVARFLLREPRLFFFVGGSIRQEFQEE